MLNLGGLALQVWMPRQARIGDTLAKASGPLLVKSVVAGLKSIGEAPALAPAARSAAYVPRGATQGVTHKVSRTYEPEFKGVTVF